jgi:hypothetical protein
VARDITEGDSNVWPLAGDGLPIARGVADIGVVATSAVWQNTDVAYDVAVGGLPFIYAINDSRPYIRQTAPFRKDQFDNGQEPGEQSLTGWWIRSQMSFHSGTGIKFYDPATTDENGHYRFADSKGVDVWTKGQATLLKDVTAGHITTGDIRTTGRRFQELRSIEWGTTKGVLLKDEYDVDKIDATGAETHFINYNAGTDAPVHGICDDGTNAYWITNTSTKKTVYKKPLTGDATNTADVVTMFDEVGLISNAVMEFVKERIVMCADNKVYEFSGSATAMPTAVYTHPSTSHIYTSITASGPAIYIAGYNGIQSTIQKFTLSTAGVMPTLTSAVVAAELPVGEVVHKIYYYLGYMMIGTNKGIRAAVVSDQDGSINYGPLIVETSQPCYDFAARDHYVWCATGVAGEPGVIRIDLSNEVETLRFAYANDIYKSGVTGRYTTACAFIDGTEQLAFTSQANIKGTQVTNKAKTSNVVTLTTSTAHGLSVGDVIWVQGVDAVSGSAFNSTTTEFTVASVPSTTTLTYTLAGSNVASTAVSSSTAHVTSPGSIYIESATQLISSGYITTGNIRYGTLEPKNFKRLLGRGDFTYGSMTLETIDKNGIEYDHIAYDAVITPVEVGTERPETAQEYVAYKFILYRDGTDTSKGPIFKGYQAKATIATPRQRVMRFPVYCFDVETDRYNTVVGYEGRAFDRIQALEEVEQNGDVLTWQDLTTGETRQAVIEQITFTRMTPPDKRFDGFGGVLEITIRTV